MPSGRDPHRTPALVRRALGQTWRGPTDAELRAEVAGRTVLITGASSGIGAATARRLGAAGAHVVLVARRKELLDTIAAEVVALGGQASVHVADLADTDQVAALVEVLVARHPVIDVVVNNAGRSIRRPLDESYDRFHDYTRTIDINYLGPVRLMLGLLPAMRANGHGHLVNISTVGVDAPGPYWSAYAGSKAAFEWWLWAVAPEARADGVTSTSIHFGVVHTAMSAPTYAGRPGGMSAREAGNVVCRAIVDKPRMLRPWWAQLMALSGTVAPGIADRVMTATVKIDRRRNRRKSRNRPLSRD